MTKLQIGRYRHGTYGYPVRVELEPESGQPPLDLTGTTVLHLSLQRINPVTDALVERDLDLADITVNGGGLVNPVITWNVLEGDIPFKGQYQMILTIDFSPTQRQIVDGKIAIA